MPRETWATPDQEDFLLGLLDEYKDAQIAGSYMRFWPALFEEWEKQYPSHQEVFPGTDLNSLSEDDQTKLREFIQKKRNVRDDQILELHKLRIPGGSN